MFGYTHAEINRYCKFIERNPSYLTHGYAYDAELDEAGRVLRVLKCNQVWCAVAYCYLQHLST